MLKATASYSLFMLFLALPTRRAALDQYHKQINCLIATVHGVVGLSTIANAAAGLAVAMGRASATTLASGGCAPSAGRSGEQTTATTMCHLQRLSRRLPPRLPPPRCLAGCPLLLQDQESPLWGQLRPQNNRLKKNSPILIVR